MGPPSLQLTWFAHGTTLTSVAAEGCLLISSLILLPAADHAGGSSSIVAEWPKAEEAPYMYVNGNTNYAIITYGRSGKGLATISLKRR